MSNHNRFCSLRKWFREIATHCCWSVKPLIWYTNSKLMWIGQISLLTEHHKPFLFRKLYHISLIWLLFIVLWCCLWHYDAIAGLHCDVITLYGFFSEADQDMTNSWFESHSLRSFDVCSDARFNNTIGFMFSNPICPVWTIAGCQKKCRSCYRTSDNISRTCHNLSALWLRRGSKITEACWVPWHRKRLISKAKRCWMLQTEIWV